MADSASMSLDEYIKKKKIRPPGNPNRKKPAGKAKPARGLHVALKTKKAKWSAKVRAPVKTGAGLRGGRRGRGAKRNNNQRRTLVFRSSGFKYNNPNVTARNLKRGNFGRKPRGGRLSMAARRELLQQLQPGVSQLTPRATFQRLRGGMKNRRATLRNKIRGRPGRSVAVAVAQQRLKKARAVLATRRRILGPNSRAATSTVSGRIVFSQYGLLTTQTQKRNVQENMISIQEKIQRAQVARGRVRQLLDPILTSPTRQGVPRQPVRSYPPAAVYTPPRRSYRESTIDFAPPSFYSGGGGGSLYSDQILNKVSRATPLRSRQVEDDDDAWVRTQRRVANTGYSNVGRYGGQSSTMSPRFQQEEPRLPNLNAEIQHRISHIQQAGRIRRAEPDKCLVVPDYRGPVSSSRMLLGERFKRLQR